MNFLIVACIGSSMENTGNYKYFIEEIIQQGLDRHARED